MNVSSEFRTSHKVVTSFNILRDAQASADFSMGLGPGTHHHAV